MDPEANLIEQLSVARAILERAEENEYSRDRLEAQAEDAERLAELVLALDGWMKKGGFSPWSQERS